MIRDPETRGGEKKREKGGQRKRGDERREGERGRGETADITLDWDKRNIGENRQQE